MWSIPFKYVGLKKNTWYLKSNKGKIVRATQIVIDKRMYEVLLKRLFLLCDSVYLKLIEVKHLFYR